MSKSGSAPTKRPERSPGAEAERRTREARRAAELRANLKRRKEDLARRGGAVSSDESET